MADRYQSAPEGYGPEYPQLKSLEKYRRAARDGLRAMDKLHVRAYGTAVEKAILALQAAQLKDHCINRGEQRPNCASGTLYTTGAEIHEAVQRQHTAALHAYPAQERRKRTPAQWKTLYNYAMRAKWKREHANPKSD